MPSKPVNVKQVLVYLTHEQHAALLKLKDRLGTPVSEHDSPGDRSLSQANGVTQMKAALYARFSRTCSGPPASKISSATAASERRRRVGRSSPRLRTKR